MFAVTTSQIKEQLRQRLVSIATPGLSGAARAQVLRERLDEEIKREKREAADAKKMSSATRTAAFRTFRLEQVRPSFRAIPPPEMAESEHLCMYTQANKRLEVAMYKGNVDGVLSAIKSGADANRVCRGGVMPLHNAVECGDIELVVLLARAGADVNAKVRC